MKNLIVLLTCLLSLNTFSSMVPPDACGDADIRVENSLRSIGGRNGCYFPKLHCVKEEECPLNMVNPNACGDDAKTVVVWDYEKMANGLSCKMPTVHCVKQDICPQFSPLPQDYCKDGETLKVEGVYRKINDKYSCYFPKALCVDQSLCPLF